MIKLYGSRPTRATRAAWMLEELGVPYTHEHSFDTLPPEARAANPNGKLPILIDDGFPVWESVAINLYLARKYGAGTSLWPESLEDQTRALMWSVWAMTELDMPLWSMISARRAYPSLAAELDEKMQRPMRVLDDELAKHAHLLGADFTVADLNVASVIEFARHGRFDFGPFAHVDAWQKKCAERPAAQRMAKLPMMPPPKMAGS